MAAPAEEEDYTPVCQSPGPDIMDDTSVEALADELEVEQAPPDTTHVELLSIAPDIAAHDQPLVV